MKAEPSEIIFVVCILVFPAVSFIVATWLMFVVTKRLANVSHGGKRRLKAIKRTALSALLVMFCSFNGCVASFYSGIATMAALKYHPEYVLVYWCVWTTVFMLICCRLYFRRTKSRFMLPVGITLGIGCAVLATLLITIDWEALFPPPPVDMKWIINPINAYADKHDGEFPASLEELTQPTGDGGRPLLGEYALADPWGQRIEYERTENGFTIRSSGPDRIMGTEDDIIKHVTNDVRQGENK